MLMWWRDRRKVAESMRQSIEALSKGEDDEGRSFYEGIAQAFDFHRYAKLRQKYDDPDVENSWFNLPFYLGIAFKFARTLDLHRCKPLQILDLACGPNYFGYVCQRLGHRAVGLDRPRPIYRKISSCLDVPFIGKAIKAQRLLPDAPPADLITAWRASFQHKRDKQLWTIDDWSFFFRDLGENRMTEQGRIHFMLNRLDHMNGLRVSSPEFAAFVEGLGGNVNGHVVTFMNAPR